MSPDGSIIGGKESILVCVAFDEGLASYHFDSPEECYISYENAPPHWRSLDPLAAMTRFRIPSVTGNNVGR